MASFLPPSTHTAIGKVLDAALRQPKPTPQLRHALNEFLTMTNHPLALKKKERQHAA